MAEGFFDKIYGATDEAKKALKKPVVRKRLKRKLQSAWDDAEERKIDAERSMEAAREDIDNYDINVILKAKKTIETSNQLQKRIVEEYKFLFGEDMEK